MARHESEWRVRSVLPVRQAGHGAPHKPGWRTGGVDKATAVSRGEKLLESVGLSSRAGHFPSQMSGGEQQRVAIARALVNRPALLLADEPTGNLDPETAENVFQVMVQTITSLKIGALVVTHNVELAYRMDRVLELKQGQLVAR